MPYELEPPLMPPEPLPGRMTLEEWKSYLRDVHVEGGVEDSHHLMYGQQAAGCVIYKGYEYRVVIWKTLWDEAYVTANYIRRWIYPKKG